MSDTTGQVIGTVLSDGETPTFETVRIKLKAGQHVKPGTLVSIPTETSGNKTTLIGRIRSAVENNPNETPESINVRDTLSMARSYPTEEDSTIIYRLAEADLIEEFVGSDIRAPQTLPNSGSDVFLAQPEDIVRALGLADDSATGLDIGETVSGTPTKVILKRDAIQRHMFICGTTGSGKSYAMGVIAEDIIRHGLPVIFLDTQDEYSSFVKAHGGTVVKPGVDFNVRISSLTESDLLKLLPSATTELQCNIAALAFSELQASLQSDGIPKFTIDNLTAHMAEVGPRLTNRPDTVATAISRTQTLARNDIFGEGIGRADWRKLMYPCMAINCKKLTSSQLQPVATAVLRELQLLRLKELISNSDRRL